MLLFTQLFYSVNDIVLSRQVIYTSLPKSLPILYLEMGILIRLSLTNHFTLELRYM
nr:MAG TPA: hypothetical protein [Caudoviricetes sp.]